MQDSTCPRCHQPVKPQALECPFCRTQLKAYGHPGIPLHRATGEDYLCDTCVYHQDDTCTYPKRPYAKECTLYQNITEMKLDLQQQRHNKAANISWLKRHQSWLLLLGLLLLCLVVAIVT